MKRKYDVITNNSSEPEILYILKNFPVNMLSNRIADEDDSVYDMEFGIFPDSGVIQILDLVPKELIYVDTHSNAIGGVWKRQHEALSEFIADAKPLSVLEIGGVLA